MKKIIALIMVVLAITVVCCGCEMSGSYTDTNNTIKIGNKLSTNQATPTDIDYSLERYNLIRRAYWVNGQREKANSLPCEIEKPLGYVVLLTDNGGVINKFTVDGKVSSLNSYLSPDSEEYAASYSKWLPDVDGSYGSNDNGIFFFTPDGKYIEWTGTYLYSDIPFEVKDTVLTFSEVQ